jgi:hypothetical protein
MVQVGPDLDTRTCLCRPHLLVFKTAPHFCENSVLKQLFTLETLQALAGVLVLGPASGVMHHL